jgi:hypothetical protein
MTEYNEIEYPTDTEIEEIQDSRSGNYILSIGHKVSKSDLERFISIFLERLDD